MDSGENYLSLLNEQVLDVDISALTIRSSSAGLLYTDTVNVSTKAVGNGLSLSSSTLSNNGVLSLTATGAGLSVSGPTGAVSIQNIGVTSLNGGSGITVSGPTGAVTVSNSGVLSLSLTGTTGINISAATGANIVISTTGLVSLTGATGVHVTGGSGNLVVFNDGVTRATGTANQVIVSAATGSVTFSLPQSIATNSTVQFGALGIGKAPSAALSVVGNMNFASDGSTLNWYNSTEATRYAYIYQSGTGGYMEINLQNNNDMFFSTNNSEKMRIKASGNVGIGESSPDLKLVARDTVATAQISARYNGTGPTNYKETQIGYNGSSGNGYGWIQAIANGVAYTPLALNLNGGNVTIGTTTTNGKLTVFPNAQASFPTLGSATGALGLHGDATSYGLFMGVVNTGSSWIQSMRSDGIGLSYPLVLQPSGSSVGIGGNPTTTGGYTTRLDIYNGAIGASLKIQDSSGSARGHIQIGSSATASNNIHIGSEGDGSFCAWNGTFGGGTEMIRSYPTGTYVGSGAGSNFLQIRGNDSTLGSSLNILNSSKTGGNASSWVVYNMGSSYGNGLQFWFYPASGGAYRSMNLQDSGNVSFETGGISVTRGKSMQFDGSPSSLDMSIHMPNVYPYGLRLSGGNDATNPRSTQFGYYAAGVWQNRLEANNYTGTLSLYSTMAVKAAAPTAAAYTCSNTNVGQSSSYANYSLLMYDSGVAADSYGVGIDSYTLWYNSYQYHKWTARNTQTMILDGSGNLTTAGTLTIGTKASIPYFCGSTLYNTSATQAVTTGAYYKCTVTSTNYYTANMTADTANRRVTATVAGVYRVTFNTGLYHDYGSTNPITFRTYVDGVAYGNPQIISVPNGSNYSNISLNDVVTCSVGTYIEIWIAVGATCTVTFYGPMFGATRAGTA